MLRLHKSLAKTWARMDDHKMGSPRWSKYNRAYVKGVDKLMEIDTRICEMEYQNYKWYLDCHSSIC